MIIQKYLYKATGSDLSYSETEFGKLNLLVGATSAGKSRFLNTMFNLGFIATRQEQSLFNGWWNITFSENDKIYNWEIKIENLKVDKEVLIEITDNKKKKIVDRSGDNFVFNNTKTPKLSRDKISSVLLSEEEDFSDIHGAFKKFYYRRFSEDDLIKVSSYGILTGDVLKDKIRPGNIETLFSVPINIRLYFLEKYFPKKYGEFLDLYKSIFPYIEDIKIRTDIDPAPIVMFYEKGISNPYQLNELSSGMKKILLLITDVFTMQKGGVYLIDEYENSLGINAINFLPEFIEDYSFNIQFFITSHHPYVINSIDIKNWYVFGRKAEQVKILHGDSVIERYGKSKQQTFIQLINDKFFTSGVE